VTVQLAMSQLELLLSPVVTSQVAPALQLTSQEAAHAPVQVVPAPQATCVLPPLGIVQA
jgi:hypothetical protein